jgi:hypothetical protein
MIFAPAILRPGIFRNAFGVGRFASPSDTDELSLDLQFATDKTLTARRGPTPAFSRASAATFVGSDGLIQSAAINAPRFDHDPVTLACKGLLIEESRTNLLARSAEFNQSPWSSSIVTITQDDGVSPDGLTAAESFLFAGTGNIVQTAVMGSTAPTATFSLFVKAKTGMGFARILVGNNVVFPSNLFGGWFNLSTGLWGTTSVTGSATLVGASVTNFNNGWYRISITGSISGSSSYTPLLYITDSDNSTVRSITVSQLWWGAQLEIGSFPTSYIPTTTAAVVRSADVCSISGANFTSFYNQSEGTFVCRYTYIKSPSLLQNRRVISGGDLRRIIHGYDLGINEKSAWYYDGTSNAAMVSGNESAAVGVVIEPNEIHAVCGLFVGLDKAHNGNLLTSMTYIRFYENTSGHITSVQYFRKVLPDANLQALTS